MFLEQYQRDNNVQTLLEAMHDAFDFAHHEDTLKSIKPQSEQARILTLMLQDVCSCCDFIQSYTRDSQFCTSSSCASLAFINVVFSGKRTLKNIAGGPEKKIKDLSDALMKRREDFLNQATISTEIAAFQILDDLGRLSSRMSDAGRWFFMVSGFTPLIEVVKDNTALRVGSRSYDTLFESLILEPLKDLPIVGPILVAIDALDESGDTTGRTGLHTFLAKNLVRLPSNFRVVITSRPEHAIVSALMKAPSVKIKYMNDTELAAETDKDISTFLQRQLPLDRFGGYVEALAVKAEGLFQWAAVASELILDPPARFVYDGETCIKYLLGPSTNRSGQDPLDKLYKEALEWYFTDQDAQVLFRSVVRPLITSIEPLSIRSLITLRHVSLNNDHDAAVTGLLIRLGSLLSNV